MLGRSAATMDRSRSDLDLTLQLQHATGGKAASSSLLGGLALVALTPAAETLTKLCRPEGALESEVSPALHGMLPRHVTGCSSRGAWALLQAGRDPPGAPFPVPRPLPQLSSRLRAFRASHAVKGSRPAGCSGCCLPLGKNIP